MRPSPLTVCGLLAAVLFLSTGCQALNGLGLQSPTAAVQAMDVTDIGGEGFTMNFDVEVSNPNAFALPLTHTAYTLSLNGAEAFSGAAQPEGTIAGQETGRVRLPVSMTYQEMLGLGKALVSSGGRVPYRFEAKLGAGSSDALGGLLSNVRVPLAYEGTLDLAALLRNPQALTSPTARKLATQMLSRFLGS